jgi:hypothetical protein
MSYSGPTQYKEDDPAATDPFGNVLLFRRRDTLSSEVSANGDVVAGNGTSKGEMYVKHVDPIDVVVISDATVTSVGLSASVSVTRPANTTAYTAGDVVGVTGGVSASINFALAAVSGSRIIINSVTLKRYATAVAAGEAGYRLHLFDVTQPAAQVDNAVFDVASGDRSAYLGYIDLQTPVDIGSTLISNNDGIGKQIKLAGTGVFGVLQTIGGYTPASAEVFVIELHAAQL